jgi:hypothetical protein
MSANKKIGYIIIEKRHNKFKTREKQKPIWNKQYLIKLVFVFLLL